MKECSERGRYFVWVMCGYMFWCHLIIATVTFPQLVPLNNCKPESVVEVMSSTIGDNLILLLTKQSNLYHSQNAEKWKVLPKTLKWSSITPEEMRKCLGLIILIGQVRKEIIRDYWPTDPTISTPIFPYTMSRNCFESIWQAWHFSDSSQ